MHRLGKKKEALDRNAEGNFLNQFKFARYKRLLKAQFAWWRSPRKKKSKVER